MIGLFYEIRRRKVGEIMASKDMNGSGRGGGEEGSG